MKSAPLDDGLFERLFSEALPDGRGPGHGVELFERRGSFLEMSEDDDGRQTLVAAERGFALRLFRAGRVAFAATGPDAAARLLPEARLLLPRARVRRGARAGTLLPGERPDGRSAGDPAPGDEAAAANLLTLFRRTVGAAGGGAVALQDASVLLGGRVERVATSGGRDVTFESRAATLVATVVARTPRGRFSARVVAAAARGEELPVARFARHAVDRVLLPLTGRPATAARVDLLLDPHVASHLVGRLAPLFLGDDDSRLFARTRAGKEAFASPLVSLVDDPAAAGGPVRVARDAEGTPPSRTVLVASGRAAGRLLDVASAARGETAPTGNAVRLMWSEPPTIGVTNFFVDPSPGVSPLDLLASVSKGLYAAVLLERPDVDLAADRFRLVVSGYAVEKGRATERVSEAVIAGRLSELLRGIVAIGDDLKFAPGAGGGVGSPTLLVPRWRGTG